LQQNYQAKMQELEKSTEKGQFKIQSKIKVGM
jgi:hypothetical protein